MSIGLRIAPQRGDMAKLRKTWEEAEALGADRLWVADHFHAQVLTKERSVKGQTRDVSQGDKNFEATTVQPAMAATTTRPEIGCIVHATSYRNPNLMADIARTIDHCSGQV